MPSLSFVMVSCVIVNYSPLIQHTSLFKQNVHQNKKPQQSPKHP